VEVSRYQKYGELLKNSVESYPIRDKIVLVTKDRHGSGENIVKKE
jgi:hypothetical protein